MKMTTVVLVIMLSVSMLLVGITSSAPYDPWYDLDDDGDIDIFDIVKMAGAYGTTGTPINKTALLLELQDGLAELNATVDSLEQRVSTLEALGTSQLKHCAGIEILTCGDYIPPPTVVNNYVKIVFPVTFTNATNISLSASGLVFSAATGIGHPVKITVIEITTTYALLAMQGFNGASWVDLALDDIVQISYVAIEAASGAHDCTVVTGSKPYNDPTTYFSGTGFVINVSDSIPSGFTLVSAFATGRKTNLIGTTLDEPPLNLLPMVNGINFEIRVWDAGGDEYDNWSNQRAHIDYTLICTK